MKGPEKLWSNRYGNNLDCDNGFTSVNICQNLPNETLYICSVYCISITLTKLSLKAGFNSHEDGYYRGKKPLKTTSVEEKVYKAETVVHCWWECSMA